MLTLTSPADTPWHRLPAAVKLAALLGFGIVLMAFTTAVPLGLGAALVIALYLPGGRPLFAQGARMLWPLWPFVLALMLFGWWDGRPGHGALIALRMLTLVAAANLVTMTTRLSDMLAVFERLARPFSPILPPRRLAMAFTLVIRFVPVMAETAARLGEAWRARSPRRPAWRIVMPVLLGALDTAEHSADALRARGGPDGTPVSGDTWIEH
ncbi:energy-coupling factor transporter transmembrane protein EcfT [Paracoccus sp. IB05]|uniref:energy-coupling factor transporter transmembrane component T family protein n=1 Tax=Paracoccus sp. IB05 TaxID=2779367 RepID=UPI0018E6EB0E|nr:energy-coupling factor transporter transmembrane component T [Paracoccus sp. IB05]MBJ2152972.1 energy-coupling factor transporter transmembrane protein EcfT [Paracoccus sp. IB05]